MSLKTLADVRSFMTEELIRLRNKESTPAVANASANIAGKIAQSVKLELEYAKLVGANPSIGFLNSLDKKMPILEADKETHEPAQKRSQPQ